MSSAPTQQPMRALYVLDQVNRGGIEVQALDAFRVAHKNGLDITLVTTGGQLLDEFRKAGDVVQLKRRWPIDLGYATRIRGIARERKFDIVQGHQAVDALHLLIATRGMHLKRVLTIEGFVPDRKNRWVLKYVVSKMDAVVFPSKALQEWVADRDGIRTGSNAYVIENGADPERISDAAFDLRVELGIESSMFLVGMVGNFYRDPRKDHFTLVRSLPMVMEQHPNVHCIIVGGVEPGAEFKLAECKSFCRAAGIADRVHFLGSRGDIAGILRSLDLFVFSSLHEGGAPTIAVIEAMFARVPVVASDIPPHVEYSSRSDISVLFETGNERDLAEKMLGLINDGEHRSQLAEHAHNYAMKNFSAAARLHRFMNLYKRLAN